MQPVVSVQETTGGAAVHHLMPGQRLRFGTCGCDGCELHLVLAPGSADRAAGQITAYGDHWRLDNHGPLTLLVTDLESSRDLVTVGKGRVQTVLPFELARVSVADRPLVTVFGPEPPAPDPAPTTCPALHLDDRANSLDRGTTYFAVLVALCTPRLVPTGVDTAPAPLPTSAEIAAKLRDQGRVVSVRAVDAHIEYLIEKLGLRPGESPPSRAVRSWRKEALVRAALRRGLVEAVDGPGARRTGKSR